MLAKFSGYTVLALWINIIRLVIGFLFIAQSSVMLLYLPPPPTVDEDFSLSQSSLSFSLDSDDPRRRCFVIIISADPLYEATEAFMVQLLDGETAIIEATTNVTIEDTTG